MTTVILFVSGAIVGSFLNVVGLRFNSGLSLGGRSACPHCGKMLKWYELFPVLSFLCLGGRCRNCRARISPQYPLVEIWAALIFVTVPYIFIPVFCIYIVITIYDLRHKIIPDTLVYSAIALSLILGQNWIAGIIIFIFFASIWFLSRGRVIGFGDAKLGLSIGFLLGAPLGLSAIIVAFWIGATVGLFLILRKKITMKSEIPFAPFIVVGAWLSLIWNLDLLHVSLF